MFRNYFKVAYRNLLKSKAASFINIFGLSVAIGCAVTVYLFMQTYYTMDGYHDHADTIFLVEYAIGEGDGEQLFGNAPVPLGPALEADFPQVAQAARVAYGSGTVRYEDTVLNERIWFVDPGFLEMFTFPMKYGQSEVLRDKQSLVLSENVAIRYFGEEDPVGKQINIRFDEGHQETFTIGAVAEAFRPNSVIRFDILLHYDKQLDLGTEHFNDWAALTGATFVRVQQPSDMVSVTAQMDRYVALQNAADEDRKIKAFTFDNLVKLSLNSYRVQNDISGGAHPAGIIMLAGIGFFLLTLACVNYMNISLATAARRMKEIGIRKVVGGQKRQIATQFLSENLMLCALALVIGAALARWFLAPSFNHMFLSNGPQLNVAFTENLGVWAFLGGLLLVTALASGAYPALYLSSFQPISIFRGRQQLGKVGAFTLLFLGFQFVLAFITMIGSVVFTMNAEYQSERDWGYNQENTLVVRLTDGDQYAVLKNEMAQHPNVLHIAGATHNVGVWQDDAAVEIRGEKVETGRYDVGFSYLDAMGLRLKQGRSFDELHGSDADQAVIINQTFAREQGWNEPVGQQIRSEGQAFTVVGVVEDFHHEGFFSPIAPVLFRIAEDADFNYLILRVQAGTGSQMADVMEATWKKLIPGIPFDSFYQDTLFDDYKRQNESISKVFGFTALMALLISCLGLYGLATQNTTRRLKEIAIRKIMGASVTSVTQLVNRRFVFILLIAAGIATPLGYFAFTGILDSVFEYHVPVDWMPFVLSYVLVLLTSAITILLQVRKVVTTNPADVLRSA